jgi:L-lactate dehydrogenase (cytochrome)
MAGRAYLYGLAVGGERGVSHVIDHLREGVERTLVLTGNRRIADLSPELVRWRDFAP